MTARLVPLASLILLCTTFVACGQADDSSSGGGGGNGDGDGGSAVPGSGGNGSGGMGGFGNPAGGSGDGDGDGDLPGTGGTSAEPPLWEVTGITTWRNDATGAYTIVHDDMCVAIADNQFDLAAPALEERGLVATFGAVAWHCDDRDLWDEMEDVIAAGHEIANHSYLHENLASPGTDVEEEMDFAHEVFADNLSVTPSFFIFPFDSFDDPLLDRLEGLGYLGARAGTRGINSANFSDGLEINFDVYGPAYSIYSGAEGTPCESVSWGDDWDETPESCRTYIMNEYVEDIIDAGGYGIRELHSINNEAWEPIPLDEYEAHLDFVVGRIDAGELWMATASDAVRYRFGREECTEATVSGDTIMIDLEGDCERFATTLTYEISSLEGSPTNITAEQGGMELDVVSLGDGDFQVNADPSAGPIEIAR